MWSCASRSRSSLRFARLGVLLPALVIAGFSAWACSDDEEQHEVTIRAEVVEPGVPVRVAPAAPAEGEGELLVHEVSVTWNGTEAVFLDDARFTHHVSSNGGDLVLSGRGCGADWDEDSRQVVHPCTADLQIVRLEPGETHAYPVRIYPEVGPLRLTAGTYVVEQEVAWWAAGAGQEFPSGNPDGTFTIRLTYTVE